MRNFLKRLWLKISQHGKGNSQSSPRGTKKKERERERKKKEAQRVPYRINLRRNMPRHILIKLTKTKHEEQILNAAREKQQITYNGIPIRITADFSTETLQARREWLDIVNILKGEDETIGT